MHSGRVLSRCCHSWGAGETPLQRDLGRARVEAWVCPFSALELQLAPSSYFAAAEKACSLNARSENRPSMPMVTGFIEGRTGGAKDVTIP